MKIGVMTHKVLKGHGQGRVNYEIVQATLRRGHQVFLVASQIAPELDLHPAVSWIRIPVTPWPTELLRNQVFAWRSFRSLRMYGQQLDVLHVNGFITWVASDVNSAHFVHRAWLRSPVHTARLRRDFYGGYQWLYTALNALLERNAYRRARVVVAVSEKVRNELIEIGVSGERICVITNGVDLQEFFPGPANRRELDLPEGVPLALFIGDIRTPRKNLDTVLRSLVEVPELHLAVVGSTMGSPYLQVAKQLGLTSRVHFLGYRRNISDLLRAADLFVFPSRYEPLGLVILEAMASGLPIVTAITTGAADLVGTECGVVMEDPDDVETLASVLKSLVRSPQTRERMGRAARAVAAEHSWRQMSEQYLQLYEQVAERNSPTGQKRANRILGRWQDISMEVDGDHLG